MTSTPRNTVQVQVVADGADGTSTLAFNMWYRPGLPWPRRHDDGHLFGKHWNGLKKQRPYIVTLFWKQLVGQEVSSRKCCRCTLNVFASKASTPMSKMMQADQTMQNNLGFGFCGLDFPHSNWFLERASLGLSNLISAMKDGFARGRHGASTTKCQWKRLTSIWAADCSNRRTPMDLSRVPTCVNLPCNVPVH